MGLDYEIAYKKGKENMVADSLSRQVQNPIVQGDCHAISILDPSISAEVCWTIIAAILSWVHEIVHSWEGDECLKDIIVQLQVDPNSLPGYSFQNGRLKFQDKLIIGPNPKLRKKNL